MGEPSRYLVLLIMSLGGPREGQMQPRGAGAAVWPHGRRQPWWCEFI